MGFDPPSPPSQIGDYSKATKLADEVRTLGIVVSQHPLNLFRPRIQRIAERRHLEPLISSTDIPARVGRKVWIPGILVTGKEVATKKQEPMIFVSFEDETSIYETVLFPAAFARFYPLLDDGWAFLVFGSVDSRSKCNRQTQQKKATKIEYAMNTDLFLSYGISLWQLFSP